MTSKVSIASFYVAAFALAAASGWVATKLVSLM